MKRITFHLSKLIITTMIITALLTPVIFSEEDQLINDQKSILQNDLRKELKLLKEGEFLRIIIRLKDQFPKEKKNAILLKSQYIKDKKQRRQLFVEALKEYTRKSQQQILDQLRILENNQMVKNIHSLWLSNVLTMEVRKEALEEILKLKGIKYIKQDIKRPVLQSTPWNISQINADDVWSIPGLHGNGVVVAVLDSGVDLDHSDLANRLWINTGEDIDHDGQFTAADNNGIDDDSNGYIDDVVGWDFQNNDNDPNDWYGHGTHVAGTVAGNGSGGTATGVAPEAKIMALGYSGDPLAGQAEAWQGMEYALENGADIVNFSSAWKDAWSPDYETWRDNSETLIDGGVLFVVAAGNDDPHVSAPGDVLTPARIPRVLAVAATDNTDTIASFSGQGPISWQNVPSYTDYIYPPGLLKPDVSAPGVGINSCKKDGGYMNMDGTSMASPHAAGFAALLLEHDPTLLPHEITYILKETAIDLGTGGPDNVYGYGRIDVQAAVDFNYAKTPTYDLMVTGINTSCWTSDIWVDNNDDGIQEDPIANTNNHLYARIKNNGGQAVGNVEVKFYYADVASIGVAGFDPNNDGDPSDGNFNYIDSYFIPVLGPNGSSQDTAEAVVNWNVAIPTGNHWCVGVGIVAHTPPNVPEVNTSNNRAFRNFFHIVVTYNQILPFEFLVYPDARRPLDPFDLEIVRKGLPQEFNIQLMVDKRIAKDWFRELEGLEIKEPDLKNMDLYEEIALKRGEFIPAYVKLQGKHGIMRGIRAPEGNPVRVVALIQAPGKKVAENIRQVKDGMKLVINAKNNEGVFGGLAFDIKFKQEAKPKPVGKWRASIHGGVTFPITNFGNYYKSSYMFAVDSSYYLNKQISVVALAGFNTFKAKPNSQKLGKTHWLNLSANLKWELSPNLLRPYVNGGFGLYIPKTGPVKPGYNLGFGFDQTLNPPNLVLELGVNYHHIWINSGDIEFYTVHAGLLFQL